jgi:asparagine synthase (glutamine-hydrolysing)
VCGICGKLNFDRQSSVSPTLVRAMADTIAHRGPDDEGFYMSGPLGLGFRRLSIIDLATGHQPLSNEDGTVWIVFNGEIYNYQELRTFLQAKGHTFKTQTDTEVIVHLYEEFGEDCVARLRGMFAFAIWDEKNKSLFLARDRVGIKPLYYFLSDKCLIFASEIKAILADPEVQPEVVPGMIDRFLTFYYVPGEETLLRNIHKLAPGSHMSVRNGKATIKQYWDLRFTPGQISVHEAETKLLALLDECVSMHMISDVPVGFLLSGGVDSTAMLGMAVGKTDHHLSSFTLGFTAPGLADERPYAQLAATRYGSEHHEMTISAREFADFMPRFAWYMEEPVCEPQAVALYYVTRLAKDFVKVLISGEGGDEAFAGYSIYRNILWMERLKRILGPLNGVLSSGLSRIGWESTPHYSACNLNPTTIAGPPVRADFSTAMARNCTPRISRTLWIVNSRPERSRDI